jgi:hypothetical protein
MDYSDVMVPELRKAIEQGRGLRTLYLIDRLEEMEPGALWEDAKPASTSPSDTTPHWS